MSYNQEGEVRLKRQRSKQAIALAMQGRWREAIAANQEIIESFPNDAEAHNRLGRAYMELGMYSQAKEAYGKAVELDPYNNIAKKNLQRLSRLGEAAVTAEEDDHVEPQHFIEEVGKAGVLNLHQLASQETLAKMTAGDRVYLGTDGPTLIVENSRGEYLGQVEPKHGLRLIKLMEGGNRYTAAVISSAEDRMTVIIREVYQDPGQAGQPSFPSRASKSFRPYAAAKAPGEESEEDAPTEEPLGLDEDGGTNNDE